MLIIGLTGGIASGKSTVANELAELGAVVLNADEAAHRVINAPEVRAELVTRWGDSILLASGDVNRRAVAERVFDKNAAATAERAFLENLLHPRIRAEFEAEIERLRETGAFGVVIDAPLLLEAGWDGICDAVVFVDSPFADSRKRAEKLRNWSLAEFEARMAAQMPIEEKRNRASHVIENDGSLVELRDRVREFWQRVQVQEKS